MLKYVDTKVVFAEIPDEITLAINISNCPCHCKGCHSPYLAEDIGKDLDEDAIVELLLKNEGITCIAFMGGDSNPAEVNWLANITRGMNDTPRCWADVKIAWYSGRQELAKEIELKNFDYIKIGPYIEEFGPLNSRTTNQRLYEVNRVSKLPDRFALKDITYKFWKNDNSGNNTDNTRNI